MLILQEISTNVNAFYKVRIHKKRKAFLCKIELKITVVKIKLCLLVSIFAQKNPLPSDRGFLTDDIGFEKRSEKISRI